METTVPSRGRAEYRVGALVAITVLTAAFLMAQAAVVPFTGILRLVETDLVLPAGAAPMDFTRALRFEPGDTGLLGTRWRLAWEQSLLRTQSAVILIESEGPVLLERSIDGSSYSNARGDRLDFAADGSAVLTRRGGVVDHFDATGRLMSRRFRNGTEHRLVYSGDGLLRRVEGPKGYFLDLVTEEGLLRLVDTSNGERVEYSYVAGELVEARVNGELVAAYAYNATGALSEISYPVAGTTTIAYDSSGRVIGRRFSDGSVEWHGYDAENGSYKITDRGGGVTTMLRNADGTTLNIVDPLGNKTVTLLHESGKPLTIRRPDGSELRFSYDALGRRTSSADGGGRMEYEYLADTGEITVITYPDGMTETLEYDEQGNLTQLARGGEVMLAIEWRADGLQSKIAQRGSPERIFDYYANGLRKTETVTGEGSYQFEYDDRGYLLKLTDPVGSSTAWTYDEGGRVVTEMDAAGGTVQLAYGESGLLDRETDPAGGEWRYKYDNLGRRIAQTDPEDRTIEYVYDAAGRNTIIRLPGGATWDYEYDAVGNVVRVKNPLGGETNTSYDSVGRVASISDAAGQVWTYEYGPSGELEMARGPGGMGVRYQRDAMGRLLEGTASSGRVEKFERDERGRLRTVSSPDGLVERLSYDSDGRVASTSDNRGTKRQFAYDSQGQLARVQTAAGLETSLSYGAVGRLTGSVNNLGEALAIAYDSRGLVKSVRRGSDLTRYEHDAAGRLSTVTGPLGGVRRLEYNLAGDLVGVTEASGDVSALSYGEDGGLERMTLPGGGVVELDYDPMGNLVREQNAGGAQRRYTYDTAGRLVQQTDALGRVTKFSYNASGLLARKQLPDGTKVNYSYDKNGRLVRVDDGVFPVGYGYDAAGRRTSIEYPKLERAIRMEYSVGGQLSRVSDPDRGTVAYEYDESGRLASIQMDGEKPFSFSFDAGDRLTSIGYPNGVAGFQEYGPDGTVDSIRYLTPAGTVLAGWDYEYDPAGNPLMEKEDAGGATAFRYDAAGRLIEETGKRGEVRYSYGVGGNRAVREDARGRIEYTYDEANRLVAAGPSGFSYDQNGNLIEKRGPSGTTRYEYDVQDQLVAVTPPNGETVRFGYAPTGERVWREDSDGRVYYLRDGTHVLAELDGNQKLTAAYLHGPGIDQPLLMIRGGQRSYLHSRLLGTVAAVSDADGKVSDRFEIDSFGRAIGSNEEATVPFLFTGRAYDHDLGIYYYRARYYDPDTGRFLSEDPNWGELDDTVQHNRYLYARNAPTRHRDPMGLAPDFFDDLNRPLSLDIAKVAGHAKKGPSVKQVIYQGAPKNSLNPAQYSRLRDLWVQRMKLQYQLLLKKPPPEVINWSVDHLNNSINMASQRGGWAKGAELAKHVEMEYVQHNQQLNQMIAKEAQRNLPVPAGQRSPVPVQPRAAIRSTGPASSGLTGASPKPLALPGNGPNTPLLPPGQGTGYKVLTRGRANLGNIPTRSGEVARGLASEGLKIAGGVGLVALTGVGNYMVGNAVGERYKSWARGRGRDPGIGSPEHVVASGEAGLRAYLVMKTAGFSEIVYWGGRTYIEMTRWQNARIEEGHAKSRLGEQQQRLEDKGYLPRMAERGRDLANQATDLRKKQLVLIASARQKGEAAKQALPKMAELTPTTTAQDCFDCQETSRRLRGTLSSLDADLDTVMENARFAVSSAQVACTRKNPDAADFEAARAGSAAQSAQSASAKLGGQIELATTQQKDLAACLGKVDRLRPFLARIPEAEGKVNQAQKLAASSRENATAAKRIHGQCAQLAGSCRLLGRATSGMKGEGEMIVLSQQCNVLNQVCAAVAADATLGESYAGTAEIEVATIDGALARLKAISTQVGACFIDPVPAGELQKLQTARTRVAGLLANASKAATRAAECARLIAAGQPPPGSGGIGGTRPGATRENRPGWTLPRPARRGRMMVSWYTPIWISSSPRTTMGSTTSSTTSRTPRSSSRPPRATSSTSAPMPSSTWQRRVGSSTRAAWAGSPLTD
jgi:RHS repeat-associated protein